MKKVSIFLAGLSLSLFLTGCVHTDLPEEEDGRTPTAVPVTANEDHEAMLRSRDPELAANKRLVYDMWRTLLDAHDTAAAEKYFDENYIQHNPIADTGREAILSFISSMGEPMPIEDRVQGKVVAIIAEKDLVVLVQADEQTEPYPYTTTWFDMFRIDRGLITEHWDHGTLPEGWGPRNYVPVVENRDHQAALESEDPLLEANKQRVYDMWRVLLDAQQIEEAPEYLAANYIQHNPMADSGLDGFLSFFRQFAQPRPAEPRVKNLVEIVAENDLVVLATVATERDADGNPYTTTWFDMFRMENGMMVEHWDTARLPKGE